MSEGIVKGLENIFFKFIADLIDEKLINNVNTLLCPAGEMTQAVINRELLSKCNVIGVLDKVPQDNRSKLREYHYNQISKLKANTIFICHATYGDLIEKDICQYVGEEDSIEIIKLSDYLTAHLTQYISSDSLEYDENKIVICKPRGGFNDMLSQITSCWVYAIEYKRKLYVDTSNSGFLDCFSNYFEQSGRLFFGMPLNVNNKSVFPSGIADKIFDYEAVLYGYDPSRVIQGKDYCYREKVSGEKISFNFDQDYSEDVLIHEQEGRNPYSICTLANLRLKKSIATEINETLSRLGNYSAIHVRNTDYKTNYHNFFIELKDKIETNILICTDDYECKQFAKSVFSEKFVSVSNIPDTQGVPLHENQNINRYNTNIDTIKDLLALGASNKIYNQKINGLNGKMVDNSISIESGFAFLSKALNKEKTVITSILRNEV